MHDISYTSSLEGITEDSLQGFFVGWPHPPTPATHLELLKNSSHCLLALDSSTHKVVGFITAVTDKTLAAYIPFLEVLPAYQKQGVGKELVQRMLETLQNYYMIDLVCDPHIQQFYESVGMKRTSAMIRRNYHKIKRAK